jgi:hypothetical protein
MAASNSRQHPDRATRVRLPSRADDLLRHHSGNRPHDISGHRSNQDMYLVQTDLHRLRDRTVSANSVPCETKAAARHLQDNVCIDRMGGTNLNLGWRIHIRCLPLGDSFSRCLTILMRNSALLNPVDLLRRWGGRSLLG